MLVGALLLLLLVSMGRRVVLLGGFALSLFVSRVEAGQCGAGCEWDVRACRAQCRRAADD